MKHPEDTVATANLMDDLDKAIPGNVDYQLGYQYEDLQKKAKQEAFLG